METVNTGWQEYEIMNGSQKAAEICKNGMCRIYQEKMLPYNLYLEEVSENDIDGRVQNLENFYHWCSSRILTLDREYAKEILNSIGASQATTDREAGKNCLVLSLSFSYGYFLDKGKGGRTEFFRNQSV